MCCGLHIFSFIVFFLVCVCALLNARTFGSPLCIWWGKTLLCFSSATMYIESLLHKNIFSIWKFDLEWGHCNILDMKQAHGSANWIIIQHLNCLLSVVLAWREGGEWGISTEQLNLKQLSCHVICTEFLFMGVDRMANNSLLWC